jgi:small subunit ribosomal protein S17
MSEQKNQHTITGTVVKVSSANTIKIATKVTKVHPLYHKRYSRTRHYVAHDPNNSVQVGDQVTIASCRPISKNKHWIVK